MPNQSANLNLPPPTGPQYFAPNQNTLPNTLTPPPLPGTTLGNLNQLPQTLITPNLNLAPTTPIAATANTIASRGILSVFARRKAEQASVDTEKAAHKIAFYRRIGEIATTGNSSILERNPLTGAMEIPKPRTGKERAKDTAVAEKQKTLFLKRTVANLDRQNSGAYLNPSAGMKLSKHRTRKAQREVNKRYERGQIDVYQRNAAINNTLAKPKASQFKPRRYQKRMARDVVRAQKSLGKEKIGSVRTYLQEHEYNSAVRKTQKWQGREQRFAQEHQDRHSARAIKKQQGSGTHSFATHQTDQIVHF